jgi:hypothetical protein
MITENSLKILLEGKPTLQRDIMLKAKPFLKKYGIDFDLSNYQNDGYLRAGGYKFWFDDEERDFRTNEPKYAGKGFADIRELLAYALDIKEAEKEHRNTWGLQTYLARSKPNKGYSNNLYKKVVSEEVLEESELSRAKADVAYRELEKKIKEKGWAINQYMNDRKERSRLSPNEMFVNKGNIGGQLYILDLKTGIAKPEGEINVGRDQELMTLFKAARHYFQKNDGNGNYPENSFQTRLFSKSEYEKGKKYEREGKYNPVYDLSDNRYKSNNRVRVRDRNYASKSLKEETIEEGSHHSKYPPAINYKHVNNYLIKARKALREGKIEEADKWAWEACSTMHEDEMQGPGVAADVNAYNVFHKQLRNIQHAILAAQKANKENN